MSLGFVCQAAGSVPQVLFQTQNSGQLFHVTPRCKCGASDSHKSGLSLGVTLNGNPRGKSSWYSRNTKPPWAGYCDAINSSKSEMVIFSAGLILPLRKGGFSATHVTDTGTFFWLLGEKR